MVCIAHKKEGQRARNVTWRTSKLSSPGKGPPLSTAGRICSAVRLACLLTFRTRNFVSNVFVGRTALKCGRAEGLGALGVCLWARFGSSRVASSCLLEKYYWSLLGLLCTVQDDFLSINLHVAANGLLI